MHTVGTVACITLTVIAHTKKSCRSRPAANGYNELFYFAVSVTVAELLAGLVSVPLKVAELNRPIRAGNQGIMNWPCN
jgi:hypothetical protein